MRRVSVRTGRNFSPARKVRSMTAPSSTRLSFVRTKAPPLPGLTCWKSTSLKTVPSTSTCMPFLNWLVLTTGERVVASVNSRLPRQPHTFEALERAHYEDDQQDHHQQADDPQSGSGDGKFHPQPLPPCGHRTPRVSADLTELVGAY